MSYINDKLDMFYEIFSLFQLKTAFAYMAYT